MKKKFATLLILLTPILVFLGFQIPAQENAVFELLLNKLSIYASRESPEKIYLHTDKAFYIPGETIWIKAYVLNGISHRLSDKSKVIYVELIDESNKLIEHRKLFIDDTSGAADIAIDRNLKQGNYRLRAFTKYMFNKDKPMIFQKELPIRIRNFTDQKRSENEEKLAISDSTMTAVGDSVLSTQEPIVRFFSGRRKSHRGDTEYCGHQNHRSAWKRTTPIGQSN